MPVIATPITSGGPPPVATLDAIPTQIFGCPIPARKRAIQTSQGQVGNVDWQVLDNGNPVDLSLYGTFPNTVGPDLSVVNIKVIDSFIRPACSQTPIYTINGVVTSLTAGEVTFGLPAGLTDKPGIYLSEIGVYNLLAQLVLTNQIYFIVNRGLFGPQDPTRMPQGPPTVAEIRLHMRDSDPQENASTLDTVQFDLAEIALALERPVLYWNESMPPINYTYTTLTYPFRYYWLEGAVAELYKMAAHWYRRNYLPASAGGVQVDDLNKAQEYEQIGQQKWAEYKEWVLRRKVSLNAESAMQSNLSPYIYGNNWGW